jgi:hypothetical protein
MSKTFEAVKDAVRRDAVLVSRHAVQELEADLLLLDTVLTATPSGELVEDYPDDPRGASCLIAFLLEEDLWVHTVWGWDERSGLAILITAYRPDPSRWESDFKTRRR